MAYQLYKKMARFGGRRLPPSGISITSTSFGLGSELAAYFERNGAHIEIFIDEENKKIAFKSSNNSETGFTMQYKNETKIGYLGLPTLVKRFPKGRYDAVKEDDMWVVKVPDIDMEDSSE